LVLDVTERKHAEAALREHQKQLQLLNENLEQKVQDKTEEVRRLASDLVQAVQHERHRISHILHDDLQQRIYAIQMQLTFLHDEFQKENETARREVSEIEKQLTEVLQVTRHLSIDLSPPILRDEGLSHAIHWLAAQMRQRYGLDIEIRANGDFTIVNEALHVLLFNCVREVLFNVVKHAQASQAVVTLQWADDRLQVEVRDNGRGFPGDMPKQQGSEEIRVEALRSGFGLSTIRYQLSLFGGRLEIHSEPGAGARIRLIVPITEEASEA
jgi:signal transduction histidine kinase